MRSPIAAAIAIGIGLVVLLGYFIPAGVGIEALGGLLTLRTVLVDWTVTLAAFATLVAIAALVGAHWRKLRARRNPDRYSFFTLAGFVAVVLFGIISYALSGNVSGFQQVVNGLQVPVETSLMAAVAVILTLASLRLFQRRKGLLSVIFAVSVLVFLLLNSGLLASLDNVPGVPLILVGLQTLPVAGGRGILLGIALGSIMAGLRILLGAERPYSG
ncbi:MAG TPA: hypothetical protein VF806_01260 [Anaerolineaceae bacterium]